MCCSAKSLPNEERGFCTWRGTKRSFCSIWTFTLWQIHTLETTDYNMGRKQYTQFVDSSSGSSGYDVVGFDFTYHHHPFTNTTPYLWPYWIKLFLGRGKKESCFYTDCWLSTEANIKKMVLCFHLICLYNYGNNSSRFEWWWFWYPIWFSFLLFTAIPLKLPKNRNQRIIWWLAAGGDIC